MKVGTQAQSVSVSRSPGPPLSDRLGPGSCSCSRPCPCPAQRLSIDPHYPTSTPCPSLLCPLFCAKSEILASLGTLLCCPYSTGSTTLAHLVHTTTCTMLTGRGESHVFPAPNLLHSTTLREAHLSPSTTTQFPPSAGATSLPHISTSAQQQHFLLFLTPKIDLICLAVCHPPVPRHSLTQHTSSNPASLLARAHSRPNLLTLARVFVFFFVLRASSFDLGPCCRIAEAASRHSLLPSQRSFSPAQCSPPPSIHNHEGSYSRRWLWHPPPTSYLDNAQATGRVRQQAHD